MTQVTTTPSRYDLLMSLDIAYEGLFVLFPAGLLLSPPKKGQLNSTSNSDGPLNSTPNVKQQ